MVRKKIIKVTRTALIGSALVTALSVIGVGYASWNDTLNISSKITTGEMNVNFVQENYCCCYKIIGWGFIGVAKVNVNVIPDSNKVQINITKFIVQSCHSQKGLWIELPVNIKNNGTFPVQRRDTYGKYSHKRLIDDHIRIYTEDHIGVDKETDNLIKINLVDLSDGTTKIIFEPMGLEIFDSWKEELDVVVDVRTICDIFNTKENFQSQSIKATTSSVLSFNESEGIDPYAVEIDESEADELIERLMSRPSIPVINPKNKLDLNEQEDKEKIVTTTPSVLSIELSETLDKLSYAVIVETKGNNEVNYK